MLKQQPLISIKHAEKLIYDMVKYGDHCHDTIRNLPEVKIKEFFELNNKPWKTLLANTRNIKNFIPYVENVLGYEWKFEGPENASITVSQYGHETAKLTGSGELSIFDYHTKFLKAMEARGVAIKKSSHSDLLSCVTHAIASIEAYITSKANIWNKNGRHPLLVIENNSNLDEKLNDWLFIMAGYKMNQSGAIWNHFDDYRTLNNTIFKHNLTGSYSVSYGEMVKLINKFRTGIAKLLFKLHQQFKEPVPSKIIRGVYLPDVFNAN